MQISFQGDYAITCLLVVHQLFIYLLDTSHDALVREEKPLLNVGFMALHEILLRSQHSKDFQCTCPQCEECRKIQINHLINYRAITLARDLHWDPQKYRERSRNPNKKSTSSPPILVYTLVVISLHGRHRRDCFGFSSFTTQLDPKQRKLNSHNNNDCALFKYSLFLASEVFKDFVASQNQLRQL